MCIKISFLLFSGCCICNYINCSKFLVAFSMSCLDTIEIWWQYQKWHEATCYLVTSKRLVWFVKFENSKKAVQTEPTQIINSVRSLRIEVIGKKCFLCGGQYQFIQKFWRRIYPVKLGTLSHSDPYHAFCKPCIQWRESKLVFMSLDFTQVECKVRCWEH